MKIGSKTLLAAGVAASTIALVGAAMAQPPAGGGFPGRGGGAPGAATPAAGGAAATTAVSTAPTYVTIDMSIDVNKPVSEVWARVGKFCDIGEWLPIAGACTIRAGKDNEMGAVRSVGSEVMVGKSQYSYTYAQVPRAGSQTPYNAYHGHLEARSTGPNTTKIYYTLMYDNSMVAGDKAAEMQRRRTTFEGALANMKILAEGGTLPAGGGRGGGGAGRGGGAPGRGN